MTRAATLAYHQRILATSGSRDRRRRATAAIAKLERCVVPPVAVAPTPAARGTPVPIDDRIESIWDGRSSLQDCLQDLRHEDTTEDRFDRVARGEPYDQTNQE